MDGSGPVRPVTDLGGRRRHDARYGTGIRYACQRRAGNGTPTDSGSYRLYRACIGKKFPENRHASS